MEVNMKKQFTIFFLALIILGLAFYHKEIVSLVLERIIYKKEIVIQESNTYALENNFTYVQATNNFKPTSKQDLKNIIYTYLDRGWNDFNFYCESDLYPTCINDVKELANDSTTLSTINNFVHPFNSYDKLYITISNFGKVNIQTTRLYSEPEKAALDKITDEILAKTIKENMTEREKIKTIHDFIINHTVYDEERAAAIKNKQNLETQNPSHKAIGPLVKGKALCSGYSDAMALFLSKLNIKNYKIASKDHVWNLVYLDNNWYHLDLTWDDPVVSNHQNLLLHDFFLITTKQLQNIDLTQHQFDTNVYIEANSGS